MIIKTWFCSRGFGPGPSLGGIGTVWNGCAGPAIRKLKNAAQASQTPIAHGMDSGWRWRLVQVAPST